MRVPLTGGAYQAHSVIASAQRSVNLFSEPMPEAEGEPSRAASYPTPGTRLLGTVGAGPIRGIRQATGGRLYVVSGSTVYRVDTTTWAGTSLGSITSGLRTPVSMADNTLDLAIVDGTRNGWHVTLATDAFSLIDNGDATFYGGDRVDFLDTYLLFNKPATPQFYSSDSLALTFDPLWFASKAAYSDLLVTLIVAKRNIWLLGAQTTEVWADVGKPDFPFEAQADVFIDHGCAAKYSPAVYDNAVFWLTSDRQGRGIVIMGAGYQTKRVSTYAIEAEIAGYARIDDAIGFCYQLSGHTFYVLTFPHADKTWAYDVTTGLWHEWLWIDSNGDEHRHRANCYGVVNGIGVVGDWQNGNLYALDQAVYTDNGQPIKRVRSFPHVVNNGKRVFYRQFVADMDAGTSSVVDPGTLTLLDATFTAPDGTSISDYTSDVGGGWVAVGGEDAGEIEDNRLVGSGGAALYASAAVPPSPDYSVRFSVIPSSYDSVAADTALWALGRATVIDTGYKVTVSADGAQYTLTLNAEGAEGASASVVMGTLTSGSYTVWLILRGTTIAAQVQRTQDGMFLRDDATWQSNPGTTAAQFTDTTYTAAGSIMIGGEWP
jgi:hypothetical protein